MILQELIRSKSRSQDKIITNGKPALHNTIPHSTATSKLFYNIAIQSPSSLEKDKPKNGTKYQDGDHHTYNSASNGG